MEKKKNSYRRYADQKRLNFILRSLNSKVGIGGKVLDVGCGNGIISLHLGSYGFNVTGIDVSPNAIEKAKAANSYSNVTFRVQSAEELQASGELFDVIICSEVLEHLMSPSDLLKVLYHSLKDRGILIVTVPNGYGPREVFVTKPILKLREKNNWIWRGVSKAKKILGYSGTTVQSAADNLDHIQFFSKRGLKRLSSENHFRITQFGKSNFIEDVFPFSIITKRFKILQAIDCKVADMLPYSCTGGFFTIWEKAQ